jgi:hypothetical protein
MKSWAFNSRWRILNSSTNRTWSWDKELKIKNFEYSYEMFTKHRNSAFERDHEIKNQR